MAPYIMKLQEKVTAEFPGRFSLGPPHTKLGFVQICCLKRRVSALAGGGSSVKTFMCP